MFTFLASAINKIILTARKKGLASKYEVVELATRMWLVWHSYEKKHNPELLGELKEIGVKLMALAGEEAPSLPD